jgi:hypothetical protein
LLSERRGGTKEGLRRANVALEGKVVCPRIGGSRIPSDDPFALCDIDRVQLQARRSHVGHGASEAAFKA